MLRSLGRAIPRPASVASSNASIKSKSQPTQEIHTEQSSNQIPEQATQSKLDIKKEENMEDNTHKTNEEVTKRVKERETRYLRAENSIELCGHIVSAGLAILRSTPFQPMQNSGIKAVARVRIDSLYKDLKESDDEGTKKLSERIARMKESGALQNMLLS
ncbi:MAG: hypothetical protein K2M30_00565 [Desulfovibrionaceae bacterium]|nr:hypothetical protein [Desulfovibrionaceae bacterium]